MLTAGQIPFIFLMLDFFRRGNNYHARSVDPSASLRARFQYQNTMFELLGEIIERLSGKHYGMTL